jgi:hypothetical protein
MRIGASRWEWRTFGEEFGATEERIRSHGRPSVRKSRETCIVSFDSPNSTWIRDGVMLIERLEKVAGAGLECWKSILESGFPLTRELLTDVFIDWNAIPPLFERPAYSIEKFLERIVTPHFRLLALEVTKEEFRSTVDGCAVEIANLAIDGRPIRSVAVDGADPVLVLATVRKLGLGFLEAIDYVKVIKRLRNVPGG